MTSSRASAARSSPYLAASARMATRWRALVGIGRQPAPSRARRRGVSRRRCASASSAAGPSPGSDRESAPAMMRSSASHQSSAVRVAETGADEDGEGHGVPPEHRPGVLEIVAVAVIERDCDAAGVGAPGRFGRRSISSTRDEAPALRLEVRRGSGRGIRRDREQARSARTPRQSRRPHMVQRHDEAARVRRRAAASAARATAKRRERRADQSVACIDIAARGGSGGRAFSLAVASSRSLAIAHDERAARAPRRAPPRRPRCASDSVVSGPQTIGREIRPDMFVGPVVERIGDDDHLVIGVGQRADDELQALQRRILLRRAQRDDVHARRPRRAG